MIWNQNFCYGYMDNAETFPNLLETHALVIIVEYDIWL